MVLMEEVERGRRGDCGGRRTGTGLGSAGQSRPATNDATQRKRRGNMLWKEVNGAAEAKMGLFMMRCWV